MHKIIPADLALKPTNIFYNTKNEAYSLKNCRWISAPSIARAAGGRLWACISMGGQTEGPDNFILLISSNDDGGTWDGPSIVLDHPDCVRLHEPMIWTDPMNQVWLTWSQSYIWWDGRGGVWASILIDADGANPRMQTPRRIMNGVMAVQPTFGLDGRWFWTVANWKSYRSSIFSLPQEQYSMLYISEDKGESFYLAGKADVERRTFDEHAVLERQDHSLMMIVRTQYGFASCESFDGGRTWSKGMPYRYGPSAKSSLRQLPDGCWLWVTHDNGGKPQRSRMSALLSADEGKSWPYALLLDGRDSVSYPGVHLDRNGRIFIVHDKGRYTDKEIMLHVIRPEDIIAGKLICPDSRLGQVIAKGGGEPVTDKEEKYRLLYEESGIIEDKEAW